MGERELGVHAAQYGLQPLDIELEGLWRSTGARSGSRATFVERLIARSCLAATLYEALVSEWRLARRAGPTREMLHKGGGRDRADGRHAGVEGN